MSLEAVAGAIGGGTPGFQPRISPPSPSKRKTADPVAPPALTWKLGIARLNTSPVGAPATFTLVDPAARRVVDPAEMVSRSRNTPYAGTVLPGRIVATFLRGEPTVLDGKAVR